ncbi:Phosphoenolpyruvate-protein phosphotransferase of PTS system (EC [Olavius sp. associated proteobacterium Delta 1]|nr:Phosphoenolpyruvate-protein phosphotransferase of PTS system (EC [Olavius sp. associated proteobacterium Delta 1]
MSQPSGELILKGINASPGICIGKAYLVDKEGVDIVARYYIEKKKRQGEIKRFKAAVKRARDEIRSVIDASPEELQRAHILETHLALLKDKMLYGKTIEIIETDGINAEWALKQVVSNLKAVFLGMADSYLKERASDIVHVSDSIMRNLVGAKAEKIADIDKRVILVARDLSPADTSQINLEKIMGFITDRGGKASHTGIVAQALEIPAVVGLKYATSRIKSDNLIIVDGNAGKVIVNPDEKSLVEYEERKIDYEQYRAVITRESHLSAETTDGIQMEVMANIELPEEVVSVKNYGGDGIGLYRTEFQYMNRTIFPSEEELFEKYKDVVEVMAPKPVTIRTLDINGDKAVANQNGQDEANPALGLRSIRYCLRKPDVFITQLRAILRAAAYGNVRILFPMISAYFEICEAKKLLDQAAESLEKEGLSYNREIEIGIMIEVPSAVVLADFLADKADFFSIGTNDLIQYALAIDRLNPHVAHLYQPLDPAVIRLVKQVADVAKNKGIEVYMCGEMAATAHHIPLLLGIGLDELSMNPQSIPHIKRVIRSLSLSDAQTFMQEVLNKRTARGVFGVLKEAYGEILNNRY